MNKKELPDVPNSYSEMKFSHYVQIINNMQSERPIDYDMDDWNEYITYVTLSILLGITVEEVKKLPNGQVFKMMANLKFLNELPTPGKSTLKLISLENVPYDTFVQYQKLRLNQFDNMTEILNLMVIDSTKEAIQNLSVQEVTDLLKKLNHSMLKSLNNSIISSAWAVVKMKVMNWLIRMKKKLLHR